MYSKKDYKNDYKKDYKEHYKEHYKRLQKTTKKDYKKRLQRLQKKIPHGIHMESEHSTQNPYGLHTEYQGECKVLLMSLGKLKKQTVLKVFSALRASSACFLSEDSEGIVEILVGAMDIRIILRKKRVALSIGICRGMKRHGRDQFHGKRGFHE